MKVIKLERDDHIKEQSEGNNRTTEANNKRSGNNPGRKTGEPALRMELAGDQTGWAGNSGDTAHGDRTEVDREENASVLGKKNQKI